MSDKLSEEIRIARNSDAKERCVLRSLVNLMGPNATLFDWAWLLDYDRRRKQLLQLNIATRSVSPVIHAEWPVGWLLSRYSRKFILRTASLPDNTRISNALSILEKKLAWRYVFRKTEEYEQKYKKNSDAQVLPLQVQTAQQRRLRRESPRINFLGRMQL